MKIQEIRKKIKDLEIKIQKEQIRLKEIHTFNFFIEEIHEDVKQLNTLLEE